MDDFWKEMTLTQTKEATGKEYRIGVSTKKNAPLMQNTNCHTIKRNRKKVEDFMWRMVKVQ